MPYGIPLGMASFCIIHIISAHDVYQVYIEERYCASFLMMGPLADESYLSNISIYQRIKHQMISSWNALIYVCLATYK